MNKTAIKSIKRNIFHNFSLRFSAILMQAFSDCLHFFREFKIDCNIDLHSANVFANNITHDKEAKNILAEATRHTRALKTVKCDKHEIIN